MKKLLKAAVAVSVALSCTPAFADKNDKSEVFTSSTFKAMELRNIGPAYMSGRIADIAIDQNNPSTWYTAVGSGGIGFGLCVELLLAPPWLLACLSG